MFPPNLALLSLALVQYVEEQPYSSLELRMSQNINLEEGRDKTKQTHTQHQHIVKSWFDASSLGNCFYEIGDLVLKWDKAREEKGKHRKF